MPLNPNSERARGWALSFLDSLNDPATLRRIAREMTPPGSVVHVSDALDRATERIARRTFGESGGCAQTGETDVVNSGPKTKKDGTGVEAGPVQESLASPVTRAKDVS